MILDGLPKLSINVKIPAAGSLKMAKDFDCFYRNTPKTHLQLLGYTYTKVARKAFTQQHN